MKKTSIAVAAVILVLITTGFWLYKRAGATEAVQYKATPVEVGTIESTVSSTGALSAVTTVQVGTQVSGQIAELLVDFNDQVKKGQLLARIDPILQRQAVREAEAGLARAQADLTKATSDYERNKKLHDQRALTDAEYDASLYAYTVAKSSLTSAEVSLERAKRNLSYTEIYAPIDGVVVERNVDVGQTVAASMSTPQLFLIANDLSQMQILASVDESDIGLIQKGQKVHFTVQPYPNQTFDGFVQQVRLQSTVLENVVNYTVAVSVNNKNGKLLPGMTATVAFLTGTAANTTIVPNAALRFEPSDEMLQELGMAKPEAPRAGGDTGRQGFRGGARQGGGGNGGARQRRSPGAVPGGVGAVARRDTVWLLGPDNKPVPAEVRVGLSDGIKTAIQGPAIKKDSRVIVGVLRGDAVTEEASSNPFQQQGGRGRRGGF